MMIEVKGVQFVNKGAELMLHAVLQKLQQYWPEADIALAPGPNSSYKARARLGAYQKIPLSKAGLELNSFSYLLPASLRNWLKTRLGLVTEADIDIVLDASGFAYSDQWPEASVIQLCGEIVRARKHRKKYILLPQAFGPFTRPADIARLKVALPMANLICAREQSSLKHVYELIGESGNLLQFPDFTNLVQPKLNDKYSSMSESVLIVPNSNMISSRNKQTLWKQNYILILKNAVQVVKNIGLNPVLLNHEGAADDEICQQVKQGTDIAVFKETDPLLVKGIIGASKAVICSRFHGCVSALSQGVPCLGTSWSHKYERLFEEYGQTEALLSADTTIEQLKQKLQQAIYAVDSAELAAKRALLKQQSEQMWQQVVAVINQKLTI
ncbi:polysaccharide pyruvyl transferase family protein [Rheinheimera muenzenbergensis]|uniref:Polysaccharide pyruvyl transferase family protein n=1 Tax=Rheinheimera muenzenbergensis TaxID=1193628 RepID=A0ABU8C1N7_9GAMM